MSSLVTTLTETLRYRGAIGQWSWVLHRLSGLGVVLFFIIHIIDTSWSVFYPGLYEKAIASYQSPLFTVGEFGLVAAVVYHAINGLRIAILDYNPRWWRFQQRAAWIVLAVTALILIPTFVLMAGHVIDHYAEDDIYIMPIGEVLAEQIPFFVGMAVATVAAVFYAGIAGVIAGDGRKQKATVPAKASGSRIERFWWSYMRISGLLIIPLVFGHLAFMHILQGVFDLTAAGAPVVGTDMINESGTATEFVAHRWNYLAAGVAVWRLYDFGLLALAAVHGFNGLRYVLTDYTMHSPLLRRASVYVCVIAVVVLMILGAGALLGTIDQTMIDMALEAQRELRGG